MEMREKLLKLARDAERQETQLSAANSLLNRIEGQPIVRQVTAKVDDVSDLDDRELLAELARYGGIPLAVDPGGKAKAKPN